VLVPGQLKGQPQPQMAHRAALLGQALRQRLAATTPKAPRDAQPDRLLQVLLTTVDRGHCSASWLHHPGPSSAWPALLPAGLANPPDDDRAPSSAFRKLREALACMGEQPTAGMRCADLGASPGGWTHVLRQCGAHVSAIDRAPLAAYLMRDPLVQFVQGDAFTWRSEAPLDWVVSDVIAYPERVLELVAAWCREGGARRVVLQMKFKGGPDWAAMARAVALARDHGWRLRGKHFFNDKHEVTWMGWPAERVL
jgi:23S rRNA (cytidine2498-2'-O)-methyltransferase